LLIDSLLTPIVESTYLVKVNNTTTSRSQMVRLNVASH